MSKLIKMCASNMCSVDYVSDSSIKQNNSNNKMLFYLGKEEVGKVLQYALKIIMSIKIKVVGELLIY